MAGERSIRVPNHDKVGRTARIDKGTIVGVLLAFGGIIGGLILEKGSLSDITQLTAAMIVFGGIIGAVLGLIQVMKNLANIEEVGRGIAVAFVATVYGVGAANILFIPAGNKIRNHAKRRMETMELMMEGVLGIVEGMNPKMIRR